VECASKTIGGVAFEHIRSGGRAALGSSMSVLSLPTDAGLHHARDDAVESRTHARPRSTPMDLDV